MLLGDSLFFVIFKVISFINIKKKTYYIDKNINFNIFSLNSQTFLGGIYSDAVVLTDPVILSRNKRYFFFFFLFI